MCFRNRVVAVSTLLFTNIEFFDKSTRFLRLAYCKLFPLIYICGNFDFGPDFSKKKKNLEISISNTMHNYIEIFVFSIYTIHTIKMYSCSIGSKPEITRHSVEVLVRM